MSSLVSALQKIGVRYTGYVRCVAFVHETAPQKVIVLDRGMLFEYNETDDAFDVMTLYQCEDMYVLLDRRCDDAYIFGSQDAGLVAMRLML